MRQPRRSDAAIGLRLLALFILVLGDSLDLVSRRRLLIKDIAEPFLGQTAGKLDSDNPLTHAEDLGVVAQHCAFDGEAVVSSDGADPVDLVCGDGNAQTRATDQQRTITLALGDQTSGGNSAVWVSGLVASVRANVSDGLDARIGLEVGLDLLLVLNAGILRGGWSVGELPYEAVGSHKHQRQRRSSIWERQTCWIWVATELAYKCINRQE